MGQVFEQNQDLHRHWQRHFVQLHGGVLRRLTKAVALVPFGRRNSGHRRPWHSQLGAERSGRSNAAPGSSNKRLHVTATVRITVGINKAEDAGGRRRMDAQIGFGDALRRVFPTTVASYLEFRGWVRQEV